MSPSPLITRLWFRFFMYLHFVLLISIPLDMIYGVAGAMGRTLNSTVLLSIIFLGTLFGLLKCLRAKSERQLLLFLAGFALYAVGISYFGETNPIMTTAALLSLFGGISAGLGAYALEKADDPVLRHMTLWIILGSLPILVLPHLVTLTADRVPNWMNELYGFTNVRALGHYSAIAIAATIGAGHAIFARGSNKPLLGPVAHFPLLVMFWLILCWSGSRAGILSLVVAFVLVQTILWRARLIEIAYNLAAAILGGALSTLYFVPGASYGLMNRIAKTTEGLAGGDVSKVSSSRTDLWAWVFERIMERPFFGWGYITMSEIKVPEFYYTHAHNIVLEFWLSFGFGVGSLALGVGIWLYICAAKAARNDPDPLAVSALMLATLLPIYSMFSAALINPYQMICFAVAVGALIGRQVLRNKTGKG